jgi:uncharacterized protein (TIGR00725 family)
MNLEEHTKAYGLPGNNADVMIFTGSGLKGRNVVNIRSCDGVIFISGGTGTLNEFTIAYDEGKPIGILEGSGGITQFVKDIIKVSKPIARRKKHTKVIYDKNPKDLVKKLLEVLR